MRRARKSKAPAGKRPKVPKADRSSRNLSGRRGKKYTKKVKPSQSNDAITAKKRPKTAKSENITAVDYLFSSSKITLGPPMTRAKYSQVSYEPS